MSVNRRVALVAVFVAVLTVAVGVPEVLHLRGSALTGGVGSQPAAHTYRHLDSAGRQVLSV